MRRRSVLIAAGGAGLARADDPLVWPLATGYAASGFHAQNLKQLAEALRAATGGSFRLDVQPDGRLAALPEIAERVSTGRLPAGEVILSGLADRWPVAGADALPFVVGGYDDATRLWACQRPVLERALAAAGLQVLMAVPWPPQGLFSSQPLASLEDLRGRRMRTYNPATRRLAELLGARPVEVPMARVGEALADGRIDAMLTSALTGVEQQVWRWMHHYYDLHAWLPKNVVLANAAAVAGLKPDHRAALLQLAADAEVRGLAASRRAALEAVDTLRAHRMEVAATPAAMALPVRRLGERFAREWVQQVGAPANAIFIPYYSQALPA